MFCSTIIPTIGRATLSRAVCSVVDQELADEFEVIVVNDSGQPLPEAEWQQSPRVKIIHTNRRNRSVARNAGAAIAKGRYFHFLDDDDWMLPGAFEALWQLAKNTNAAWLYGGFRLVDSKGSTIGEISPEEVGNCYVQVLASEWLPLQASFIESTAFFHVGGFASLPSLLGGYEDIDLSRQLALHYDFAQTSQPVAIIRAGDESSTTDYQNLFHQNRQSREKALSAAGTFTRLFASAKNNPVNPDYWQGRIIYYYLASIGWNLRRKQICTATSRAIYALGALVRTGTSIFSVPFWNGLLKPHHNRVRAAFEESRSSVFANTRWN